MSDRVLNHDVFLSHSSKDKAAVSAVAERLRGDKVRIVSQSPTRPIGTVTAESAGWAIGELPGRSDKLTRERCGRSAISKSRQGRPRIAHGFNRGFRWKEAKAPEGRKKDRAQPTWSFVPDGTVQPSIFGKPAGESPATVRDG